MEDESEYRALLAVDIERSAGRGNAALRRIREALSDALRESFELSGIGWEECLRADLGDGMQVTAPAGVRKSALIHPLIHELAARLRAHNRLAGEATRIRVRAALHAGSVDIGPSGRVVGQPLEALARMLDAAPLRDALAAAPEAATVALLISGHFHDETVGHGCPGIDPESFHEVAFTHKEYAASAWLHLPGGPVPVQDNGRVPARNGTDGRRPPGQHSKMTNKASGHGVVYANQNGDQTIHINPGS